VRARNPLICCAPAAAPLPSASAAERGFLVALVNFSAARAIDARAESLPAPGALAPHPSAAPQPPAVPGSKPGGDASAAGSRVAFKAEAEAESGAGLGPESPAAEARGGNGGLGLRQLDVRDLRALLANSNLRVRSRALLWGDIVPG
jgi:hypothetical protein